MEEDDDIEGSIENGVTTKCQIRNGNMRLSVDHDPKPPLVNSAPLLVPPTLAEAKKSMKIKVQTECQQHTAGQNIKKSPDKKTREIK